MIDWGNVALYAVCAATCIINIITLNRAQGVEDRIKARLEAAPWLDQSNERSPK